MLFQSFEFAIFFPIIFGLYWTIFRNNLRQQNIFLVLASFVFYGWWDWRFLGLMIFSAGIDFLIAILMHDGHSKKRRKSLLAISLIANLGILGFFKYFNFFIQNFIEVFRFFGHAPQIQTLKIILPVGISFYTLQALSYTIDVYRGKIKPTRDFTIYFGYISFFPQLVAGPIERAGQLLPQFNRPRSFDIGLATEGMRRILLGLFMKVVVADGCGRIADQLFNNPTHFVHYELMTGIILFAIQVYADFAGYSEIAIGTASLLGFRLMRNFAFPFFSTDIAMLWRRWHMSLTSWFRDYFFVLLDKGHTSRKRFALNVSLIYLISGCWHGATWNYLIWGIMNASFVAIYILTTKPDQNRSKPAWRMLTTFLLFAVSLSITRYTSLNDSFKYYRAIFSTPVEQHHSALLQPDALITLIMISLLFLFEWASRFKPYGLAFISEWNNRWLRLGLYVLLFMFILTSSGHQKPFFYFKF